MRDKHAAPPPRHGCSALTGARAWAPRADGDSYYIEVFSKAYRRQFEGDAVTRRRLQLELLVNGNLPDVPEGQCATPEKGAAPMASGAAANDGVAEGGGSADGDAAASDDDHLKNE